MNICETYNGSAAVCRAANITPRMLQNWDETGLVSPKHCGHKRIYTIEEERFVRMVAQLKRKGMTLQDIRKIAGRLRGICRDRESGWMIVSNRTKTFSYSTQEFAVKFTQSPAEVCLLAEGAKGAVWVVKF